MHATWANAPSNMVHMRSQIGGYCISRMSFFDQRRHYKPVNLIFQTMLTLTCLCSTADPSFNFCPTVSPTDGVAYVVDTPSRWLAQQTMTQCTLQCGFSTSLNNGGTCRSFNYNSTSMNCSMFNYEPARTASDKTNKMIAFQVNFRLDEFSHLAVGRTELRVTYLM